MPSSSDRSISTKIVYGLCGLVATGFLSSYGMLWMRTINGIDSRLDTMEKTMGCMRDELKIVVRDVQWMRNGGKSVNAEQAGRE